MLRLSYRGIWIHTVNGADGDHWTQVLALRLGLPLIGRLAVGADLTAVRRDSFFSDFSDVHRKDAAARLYFIWRTKE